MNGFFTEKQELLHNEVLKRTKGKVWPNGAYYPSDKEIKDDFDQCVENVLDQVFSECVQ